MGCKEWYSSHKVWLKIVFLALSSVSLHIGIINTIMKTLVKEIVNLSTIKKVHMKSDVIGGSIVDGLRQPILFTFILDKSSGKIFFCEPEKEHFKK